ncbi:EthD family reductase [Rhodococcus globerulus]|uniref:EthD family reductase n=1 Tax=Rhodococcus globerulus TaxID=33008 RepID=UPI001FD0DF54|nr:EthD family reductase [Rhodococcus globerulus]
MWRKPGMSFAEFDTYWRDVHAPLAAQVPGIMSYIQRHRVFPAGTAGEGDGLDGAPDGFAIIEYANHEDFERAWASDEGKVALADIEHFRGERQMLHFEDIVVVNRAAVVDTTHPPLVTFTEVPAEEEG